MLIANPRNNFYHNYLKDGGEMGQLIRSFDWASTSIGSPDEWSQNLLTTVSIILNSGFPMFLWWGPDLIQFYNDAFRPSFGNDNKHPHALGQKGEECWIELWPVIKPLIDHVWTTGEPTWSEDQLMPVFRNNRLEEAYGTFSYSRIIDESGNCAGILAICNETTDKVKARKAESEAKHQLEMSQAETSRQRDYLNRFIMQSPEGICVLDGPNMVYELFNPAYQEIVSNRAVVGESVFGALPELIEVHVPIILKEVYATGQKFEAKEVLIPIPLYEGAPPQNRYFNYTCIPRFNENDKVDGVVVYVFEVTEIVQAKRQVEESENQFKFMLNAIPQQVWTAKPDGMLDYINQIVSDEFGANLLVMEGNGWQHVVHPDDLPECMRIWETSLRTGTEAMIEFRLRLKDGNYKWFLCRSLPMLEDGKIKLWLGTNTNIDLQKNNELRKDEFLSIVSHELKTPLTSLKASMQIIQKLVKTVPESNKMPFFIDKANNNLSKLLSLLDDLMNVSKIQHGHLQLNKAKINLFDLVNECCEQARMIGDHQLILTGDEKIVIDADSRRLDQVIVNLLNNAVKYAPQSKKIEVTVERDAKNAKVSVRDFGIGVRSDKLPHLFDRYYRADASGVQFSGLGLGLYICAEIINRHDGHIGVESVVGKGSTFWFSLPIN